MEKQNALCSIWFLKHILRNLNVINKHLYEYSRLPNIYTVQKQFEKYQKHVALDEKQAYLIKIRIQNRIFWEPDTGFPWFGYPDPAELKFLDP